MDIACGDPGGFVLSRRGGCAVFRRRRRGGGSGSFLSRLREARAARAIPDANEQISTAGGAVRSVHTNEWFTCLHPLLYRRPAAAVPPQGRTRAVIHRSRHYHRHRRGLKRSGSGLASGFGIRCSELGGYVGCERPSVNEAWPPPTPPLLEGRRKVSLPSREAARRRVECAHLDIASRRTDKGVGDRC